MVEEKDIQRFAQLLNEADCILIGAGAGLSADAGNDYMDNESFSQNYPELVELGFQVKAQLMGFNLLPPDLEWSYLARHIQEARFVLPPQDIYVKLFELVKDKDYYVITSNVDYLFVKNGFDEERVYTPQGDYASLQCLKPCTQEVWETKPLIKKIFPKIDPKTKRLTDLSVIPKCPNCGGSVFMNVRGGNWYIEEPYKEQEKNFEKWIQKSIKCNLLAIEIGAGFNTPGVIRWPMERVVYQHSNAHLIRINLNYPQVPKEISNHSLIFKDSAKSIINAVYEMTSQNKKLV